MAQWEEDVYLGGRLNLINGPAHIFPEDTAQSSRGGATLWDRVWGPTPEALGPRRLWGPKEALGAIH